MTEPRDHHHAGHDHAGHDHAGHDHDYAAEVRAFRADKDAAFRTAAASPIPRDARAAFAGLPYFAVDEALRFEGLHLEPYQGDEPANVELPTSDHRLRPARRAGRFRFAIGGQTHALTAYAFDDAHSHTLFVPFLDATSGRETYGAGRYLDLEPEADGSYALDFNLAYHPFCVYNEAYSCPLTPAENRLPIRIEAGERLPEDEPAS